MIIIYLQHTDKPGESIVLWTGDVKGAIRKYNQPDVDIEIMDTTNMVEWPAHWPLDRFMKKD